MKKLLSAYSLAIVMAITPFVMPKDAEAVPAFARQTGYSCQTCHYQHYPELNQFGRAFKSGGMIEAGGQSLIEDDILSIPVVLNASLILKARYQKTGGKLDTGTNSGEIQFPDEAALFLGGRIAENIGFALEAQLGDSDSAVFDTFRMPFVYDVGIAKLNIVPYRTPAMGAAFGFELLNTGAVRNIRTLEHRKDISSQQFVLSSDITEGAAEGVAIVLANDWGYINYSAWGPAAGTTDYSPLSNYGRIALTPQIAGWDLGIGGQIWSGKGNVTIDLANYIATGEVAYDDAGTRISVLIDAYAVDAQAQGSLFGVPIGLYLTHTEAPKLDANDADVSLFNNNPRKRKADSVVLEIGIIPNRLMISGAYLAGDTGENADNKNNKVYAATAGLIYMLNQNVELQVNHTEYHGSHYDIVANNEGGDGDYLTTFMLFAAF